MLLFGLFNEAKQELSKKLSLKVGCFRKYIHRFLYCRLNEYLDS